MMLLAVAQIVMREVFSTGFVWADELIKLMVLWLAMIGSVAASRDNRHIRIDALSHILPKPAIKLTRILVDLFAVAVCAVVAWYSYQYLLVEIEFVDEELVLGDKPAWIAHLIVPLGFALVAYRFAVSIAWQIYGFATGDESEGIE
jgi:TRAP-type C4-dicarboxylate transport system permease small subunit